MFASVASPALGIVAAGKEAGRTIAASRGAPRSGASSRPAASEVGALFPSVRARRGGAVGLSERAARVVRTAATEGEMGGSYGEVFPRVKERDPYRRLGIDAEANFEEVQDARNYLVEQYRGHEAGVEAIEDAFDRIIKQKLVVRKKAKSMKAAMKKKKDDDYLPPFLERLKEQFARPDDQTLIRRAVLYAIMIGWAIVQSGGNPAFQLFVGFGTTVFFLNQKRGGDRNALGRDFINAFVFLILGALVGSVFPVYIPIFPSSFSPELVLSLFAFVSFFICATFYK